VTLGEGNLSGRLRGTGPTLLCNRPSSLRQGREEAEGIVFFRKSHFGIERNIREKPVRRGEREIRMGPLLREGSGSSCLDERAMSKNWKGWEETSPLV